MEKVGEVRGKEEAASVSVVKEKKPISKNSKIISYYISSNSILLT